MPLKSIVVVILRLYAIQQTVYGLLSLIGAMRSEVGTFHSIENYMIYIIPLMSLALAGIIYFAAPLLSNLATKDCNSELNLSGLSLQDLYSFAFVFLGLSFVLGAIGPIFNWLHYWFVVGASSISESDQNMAKSFYTLSQYGIQIAAGFVSMIYARRFAKKLSGIKN
ncbi:MAG: hypothetical protein WC491_03785 [Candidatus Omnitrophota bacterium]